MIPRYVTPDFTDWHKPGSWDWVIEEKHPYLPTIIFKENDVSTTVFDSKIGGIPYMPADFEYPIVTEGIDKGEPIPFLAQINFRKAPRLAGFPTKGIMQFYCYGNSFYEYDSDQVEHIKQSRYRVIYFPEIMLEKHLKKEADFPEIHLESLCLKETRLDAQYPTFSHMSLKDRSVGITLAPHFNCASVESFTDYLDEFKERLYDKREWENTQNCLGGYPELVSNYSGDLYVNHNKLKKLFLQITGDSVKIPRILFFISEQDILEENYTKLCLAK